ncbi:MAG: hypothetical protein DRR06_17475 [Gammaproteobacteria bacterium]|nr:MAG: hypothetical protein DRR06_17475 [Gammaproteobacteria bacterium]RLA49026.1 MAG: hypothetical protein DRR42_16090 [Gammaproteobacteria bacterium]
MTLGNFADLAEIISSIAVLITLIFLVVQLRDNTKALRMSALSAHYTDGLELVGDGSRTPELASAAYKAFRNQPLDGMEKYHFSNWIVRIVGLMERALLSQHDGVLDQRTFETSILAGKNILRTPAGRESYELLVRGELCGPEIKGYIDSFYAELDRKAGQVSQQPAEGEPA